MGAVVGSQDKVRVRFNPHLFDTFVVAATGAPITRASALAICGKSAWAIVQG